MHLTVRHLCFNKGMVILLFGYFGDLLTYLPLYYFQIVVEVLFFTRVFLWNMNHKTYNEYVLIH